VTGLQAVRVAARIRRELKTEVDMIHGRYGEFKVLVDGQIVSEGGPMGFPPSAKKVVADVRDQLAHRPEPGIDSPGYSSSA
jgi:predicted Rdx family selenoprotein